MTRFFHLPCFPRVPNKTYLVIVGDLRQLLSAFEKRLDRKIYEFLVKLFRYISRIMMIRYCKIYNVPFEIRERTVKGTSYLRLATSIVLVDVRLNY